jgi:hypothetical protein
MLECKLTQKSRVNISGSKEKRGNLWHSNRVLGRVLTQLPDPSLVWFLILHHKSTYNDYFWLMLHLRDKLKKYGDGLTGVLGKISARIFLYRLTGCLDRALSAGQK